MSGTSRLRSRSRVPAALRRRGWGAVLAVLLLASALTACSSSGGSAQNSYQFSGATKIGTVIPPAQREPAAKVDGSLLIGDGSTTLASRRGTVTVMPFWASWCPPCRVEMPQLQGLHSSLGGKVDFLGIDTQDARGTARSFVTDNNIDFPILFDQQGETALRLGNIPGKLPFTVLIDKQGRVAAVYFERYTTKDLQRALDTLLAEK